ncbi:Uncharacterised protein [uncultured archaeon]|nr:Uncharacterised protein [uncultured archaeon]
MGDGILAFDVLAAVIGSVLGILVLVMAVYLRSRRDPRKFQPIVGPFIFGLALFVLSFISHALGHFGWVSEGTSDLMAHLGFIAAIVMFSLVIPRFHSIVLKGYK